MLYCYTSSKCGHFPKYMCFVGSVMLRNIASSNFSKVCSVLLSFCPQVLKRDSSGRFRALDEYGDDLALVFGFGQKSPYQMC
jgi:hypothetical protein